MNPDPLSEAEQAEVFKVANELGQTIATNMAHSFAGLVVATNPDKDEETVFQTFDRIFRDNLKKIQAMTPDEYARYIKHREYLESKEQTRRDYERAKRKLHDAQWTLRHARYAAMKVWICDIVHEVLEVL